MALSKKQKAEIIAKHGGDEKHAGSTVVQIALLTGEIQALTDHLLKNKKDNISKRGLFMKVSQRKAALTYLQRTDIEAARKIAKELNIRG